jgi:hypothetical protein
MRLNQITTPMVYEPGSDAYKMWEALSASYATQIPNGSTVIVYLKNPSLTGIFNLVERPILECKGVKIIEYYLK